MAAKPSHAPRWVPTGKRYRILETILETISSILNFAALGIAVYLLYQFAFRSDQPLETPQRLLIVGLAGLLIINALHMAVLFGIRRRREKAERFQKRPGSQVLHDWDSFQEILRREMRRGGRYHLPMSLCCISIDGYQALSHQHGRGYADKLIEKFSELTMGIIRSSDYLALLNENEFCVLLCHTDLTNAENFLFRALLQAQERLEISFSAGLTAYRTGESLQEFLKRARQALYQAHQEGQKKIHCAIGKDNSQVTKTF